MKPIPESKLKGKYVEYRDKNGAYRIGKVKKIRSSLVTIETFQPSTRNGKRKVGMKVRVHKENVLKRVTGKKYQEIIWGR